MYVSICQYYPLDIIFKSIILIKYLPPSHLKIESFDILKENISFTIIFFSSFIFITCQYVEKTRMSTFSNTKLKKPDGQTNIKKYRVAAHKILQNILL